MVPPEVMVSGLKSTGTGVVPARKRGFPNSKGDVPDNKGDFPDSKGDFPEG
jgi:hypothetical protein